MQDLTKPQHHKFKILIAYSIDNLQSDTGRMYVEAWAKYSNFDVYYLHVVNDAEILVDLNEFDIIFNNYCVRYCFEGYVSQHWIKKLKLFTGIKIISVQDDYDNTNRTRSAILDCGFDVVLTPVEKKYHPYVYGSDVLKQAQIYHWLTGFTPEIPKLSSQPLPLMQRPIVVGYRGRDIGARYGKLAYLKANVGTVFAKYCKDHDIAHDISIDESARIYAGGWFEFLASCRAVLGSDSGSNVFDFEGKIKKQFDIMTHELGAPPDYNSFEPYTHKSETKIQMGEISPRVFEAAALGTALVLVEGRYSGIIYPDEHYISVKKDFSNIDKVMARLNSADELLAMTQRAHKTLILSELYTYKAAINRLETIIHATYTKKYGQKERQYPHNREGIGLDAAFSHEIKAIDRVSRSPLSYTEHKVDLLIRTGRVFDPNICTLPDFDHLVKCRKRGIKSLVAVARFSKDKALKASSNSTLTRFLFAESEARVWAQQMNALTLSPYIKPDERLLAQRSIGFQSLGIVEDAYNRELVTLDKSLSQSLPLNPIQRLIMLFIKRGRGSLGLSLKAIVHGIKNHTMRFLRF